jgi:hypothetical protein
MANDYVDGKLSRAMQFNGNAPYILHKTRGKVIAEGEVYDKRALLFKPAITKKFRAGDSPLSK